MSKGHKELHEKIKDLGFNQHQIIDSCCVDGCNEELKIVIEYNGDYWHCNPEKFKPDDYVKAIKMTAREKWNLDRNRYIVLRNFGYKVFVIWESEWEKDKQTCIDRIKDLCYEVIKERKYSEEIVL